MGMGGGKGGASAPTIDPRPAINQFNKAADEIAAKYPEALKVMQSAILQGTDLTLQGLSKQQQATLPYSETALDAMNELRMMTGMAPISPTAAMAGRMQNVIDRATSSGVKVPKELQMKFNAAVNSLEGAESIEDIDARAKSVTQVQQSLTDVTGGLDKLAADYRKKTMEVPGKPGLYKVERNGRLVGNYTYDQLPAQYKAQLARAGLPPEYGAPATTKPDPSGQATADVIDNWTTELSDISTDFSTKYTKEAGKGYTPEEIQKKVESTPGYQFQLGQGLKAIERTQAAKGMLSSGNTLMAAQEYGAGLASQTYQQSLQNYASLAGMNLPSAGAYAQGLGQMGQFQGQQAQVYGGITQQSMQDVANARAGAYNNAGNAYLQTAIKNAEMQMEAQKANMASQNAMMSGVFGLAKGFF